MAPNLLILLPGILLLLLPLFSATSTQYFPNLNIHGRKSSQKQNQKLLSTMIGIQGLIYCNNSGSNLIPLEGAAARISCKAVDEHGYETAPVSILSGATDVKGFFFATLSPSEVEDKWRLKECRAFLELSPMENCSVPTDFNGGVSGSLLSSYRFLDEKKMKLFTVGPFFFGEEEEEPESKVISNGY